MSEEKNKKEMPTLEEAIKKYQTFGTKLVLVYPEKEIIFNNSAQSAVKSLKVNVHSSESEDMAILHKLYTQIRD